MRSSYVPILIIIFLYFCSCNRQDPNDKPFLTSNKSSFIVDPFGGKDSIIITSNVNWTITIPTASPWITADKLTGTSGVTTVYLTSEKNQLNQSRNAVISIGSSNQGVQSISISFSQENLGITSFSPVKGPANTTVTILGNFGPNPIVTLNNTACTATAVLLFKSYSPLRLQAVQEKLQSVLVVFL